MSKHTLRLALLTLSVAFAPSARADLITWGTPQNATGPLEVSLNGTLVAARNPWNGSSSSPVVNGVTFTAFSPTGWPNGGNTLLNGSTSGDAGYDTLISTSRATSEVTQTNPTGWGGIRIDSLGTLNVGTTYEIQVWFSDQRSGAGTGPANTALFDRQMVYSSATGPANIGTTGIISNLGSLTQGAVSAPLEADPNNTAGAGDTVLGQYVIGTFTRTSSDQIWLLVQGSHPTSTFILRPNVNAFQIRALPASTPTTSACLGDGTGAACPCANTGATGNGCANSTFAAGANLSATGIAGASAGTDTWVLTGTNLPGPGLFFQSNGLAGTPINFGDGHLCAAIGLTRLGVVFPDAFGVAMYPGGLTPNPIHVAGAPINAGDVKHYQCWYRSLPALCGGGNYGLTQALTVTWGP